jgi:dihydrolipoamide dehydrogenase
MGVLYIKDVVVIGGGPGGYGAAIRSAQLKGKVLLIEKSKLGGVCNSIGCIPTKTLMETVRLLSLIKKSKDFGITCREVSVDFGLMMRGVNKIVERLTRGLEYLMKANGIEVVKGIGRMLSSGEVEVRSPNGQKRTIRCKNVIIATGSVPSVIPVPGLDRSKLLTPESILGLKEKPKSLLITGGSPWDIELAFIFKALGVDVTYAHTSASLFPGMDEMLCTQMERILKKRGIKTLLNARLEEARDWKLLVKTISEVKEIAAELVLSTARKPFTEELGLEKIGVKLQGDKIKVNGHMETNVSGVYAAGDVTGGDLAYVALEEGLVAAENAMGDSREINRKAIPKVLFTIPQMATVGLTEKEAKKEGYTVKVGKFPFTASGRAVTLREKEGFVKVLVDTEFGEIVGVHILGPGAIPMIAEASLAIKMETTAEDVSTTFHAHPTLSEALKEAFLDIEGKAIHNTTT